MPLTLIATDASTNLAGMDASPTDSISDVTQLSTPGLSHRHQGFRQCVSISSPMPETGTELKTAHRVHPIEPGAVVPVRNASDAGKSSATRKCRYPLFNNGGVCRRASGAAPGAWPRSDLACRGAGAAVSPGVQLKRAELTRRPRAQCHAQLHSSRACEVCDCTCACDWLRACLNRPHGAGWANPGNCRMQITTALAWMGLGPRPRPGPCAARSPDPECTRPVVPNGNALTTRMRSFWVNGGPCTIKMLW